MSTGPTTQSSSLQEDDNPARDASPTALHYLSQEVSKLTSPVHNSFIQTDSVWCHCEEEEQSLHCPSMSFIPQVENPQSPLKLLNLINQQCARILNQSEDEDSGNSNITFGPSALEESEQTLNHERHCVKRSDSRLKKDCRLEDAGVYPVNAVVTNNKEKVQTEERGFTVGASQSSELKFSVALDLGSDWTDECLSTQYTFYDFLPEPHANKELSSDEHLHFSTNETEPLLLLDHNANICLNPDDTLMESESEKPSHSFQQQPSDAHGNTASTCEDSSEEIPAPRAENTLTHCTPLEKNSGVQCTVPCSTWRSKRRKQANPSRSASTQDPDFQGVTFRMDTELDDSKEHCRLLITSKYSTDLSKNVKRTRLRTRMSQRFLQTSSDEDSDSATSDAKSKVCASCCTSKTPMWRDAEDGTPLCNACGIRYKKYRVRCINCWHIPKKDGNSVSRCVRCGHFVRLTSAQRKATTKQSLQ